MWAISSSTARSERFFTLESTASTFPSTNCTAGCDPNEAIKMLLLLMDPNHSSRLSECAFFEKASTPTDLAQSVVSSHAEQYHGRSPAGER